MDGLQRGLAVRAKNELAAILARAAVGRERGDAVTAIAHAYRAWAREHPGRYAAAQHAPAGDDSDDVAASQAVLGVVTAVLTGYQLRDDDAIDATRALRSTLHGFVTLELAGDFALPVDVDRSFERLIHGLVTALANWTDQPTGHAASMTAATTQLDFAADDGIVAGTPRRMLRLEGAAVAAGALIAYTTTNEAKWLIALTILLPDLSAIGFLAGSRVGTHLYSAAHTSSVPVIVVAIGLWQHTPLATALALVWLATSASTGRSATD